MTEREGEDAGHLYCNTPKCIVTGAEACWLGNRIAIHQGVL